MSEASTQVPKTRPLRLLLFAAAVLLAFAVTWLAWSQAASRRLQARVQGIMGRHEPIYPQDFAVAPVPKAENAATYLQAATAAMSGTARPPSDSNTLIFYKDYPPFPPAWHQMADQAVAANQKSLALARQARSFDRADWGMTPNAFVWLFTPNQSLACLLADGALVAHFQLDDAEAIERVRDLWHEAETLDNGPTGEMGHAFATNFESRANKRLELMAPDLQIADGSGGSPAAGRSREVSRNVLHAMIGELLDDTRPRERRRRAVLSSRSDLYAQFRAIHAGATILRPMLDLETGRGLDDMACLLRALEEPTFASAENVLSQWTPHESPNANVPSWNTKISPKPPRYSHLVSSQFKKPDQYLTFEWRAIGERRLAATDLAIQMYRADHRAWPPSLNALVPEYLPMVPEDPFGAANQPLGYIVLHGVPAGIAERPLLYFDVPPGGVPGSPPAEPSFAPSRTEAQWLDVSRWVPPGTAPATLP